MTDLGQAPRAGRKFLNPVPTQVGGLSLMRKVLPLYIRGMFSPSQETVPDPPLPRFATDPAAYVPPSASGVRITWFGHSSNLIQLDGVTILIDPVWDERASPSRWFGPKRFFPPTLPLKLLPSLDAVLLSHDHYDHLGERTVRALAQLRPDLRWVCPLALGAILRQWGVRPDTITELDWTGSTVIRSTTTQARSTTTQAELTVTAVPTRHFSGRSLSNRFETLWASYVLAGSRHRLYFGADTGFWDGFASIASDYGPFDLTLLEIGAFHELWRDIHLGPDGAVEAFEQLGGGTLMPIHWGLFNLALHGWRQPITRVFELADQRGLKLFSPEPGQPTDFLPGVEVRSSWWQPQS